MTERKYSLEEIDRMRRAIEWSYPAGVSYYPEQRSAEVENRLRTYMQNGTDPKELEDAMQERLRSRQALSQPEVRWDS